jgi:hypothetical protein
VSRQEQQQRQRDERLKRYAGLRDEGMRAVDAARELGMGDTTREVYERWYREQRNLRSGDVGPADTKRHMLPYPFGD